MEKVIALIDSDPVIQENCQKIDEVEEHMRQQLEFLKKQAKDIHDKYHHDIKPFWKNLEDHLEKKGLLKSYNQSNQHLCMNSKANAIKIVDDESQNPIDFIKRLLT